MAPPRKLLTRCFLALAAGALVLTARGLQSPRRRCARQAAERETRSKIELGLRLDAALRDPKAIDRNDAQAVKAAWGQDSAKLLELLRDADG